ncbi:hypothetical protein HK57_00584 [Aspergillus ustus]|uniref:Uncharacterized protein n=1 Tax=Aspergillus ustus TaxID=40382 RepID=A0A0C1BVW0_ASPUT|nr:hypothetical protein HK57_00584 [Aspergillus ustus]
MMTMMLVALAIWAPSLITAQICTPANGSSTYNITSTRQALDLFSDCTTIVADQISIDDWDNGTFSLGGITNITGTIIYNYEGNIAALELPDLRYLGGFISTTTTGISSILFSQLLSVTGRIEIRAPGAETQVSFPKMWIAGAVTVKGPVSVVDLNALQAVRGDLILEDILAVPLPQLQTAAYIRISGIPSYIEMPLLTSVGASSDVQSLPSSSGMEINQVNSGIKLEFPALISVDRLLDIRGTVISLSLPSLLFITGTLHIDPSVRLSVDLPLTSVTTIELEGGISNALGSGLDESSYYKENCAKYEQHLSTGGKIAAGVVVPLAVFGIIVALIFWHKKRVRRGGKAVGRVVGDVEMVDLGPGAGGGEGDTASERERDLERGRIPVTQPGMMVRERSPTPPPPYEPRREQEAEQHMVMS